MIELTLNLLCGVFWVAVVIMVIDFLIVIGIVSK